MSRPVLAIHPDVNLLTQNFALFRESPTIQRGSISAFIAQNDTLPCEFSRNTLDASLILATGSSLVNKAADPNFQKELADFGAKGGVVFVDEGQTAAADELSQLLKTIARAGGSGILFTATPFRTDLRDILEPFGASVEQDLIDVAGYDEVMATGRIVPTRFDIATDEFEQLIGAEAANLIEEQFIALLGQNKSIDQASRLAFSRFFKPDASPADSAIADLIVNAVGEIWTRRAASHNTTMVHCDSVEFARSLASRLASLELPHGHARAGKHPSVAFVVASEIRMWRDNVPYDRLGKRRARRHDVLEAARAGTFDVLVNVNALGTGTDVPQTDLNIIAAQERSIGPLKQNSGRGERASPSTGKTHQTFVDIGNSVYRIFNDVDAMRRNDPERSRRQVRGLAAPIRAQFEAWFDSDPHIRNSIEARTRQIRTRQGGISTARHIADEPDPTMEFGSDAQLPVPHPFATGIYATGNRRWDSEARRFSGRSALFLDLKGMGLLPAQTAPEAPKWLVVTHDSKLNALQAFATVSLENARKFAAFVGVHYDEEFDNVAPSRAQISFVNRLQSLHQKQQRLISGYARPVAKTQTETMIDLLNDGGRLLGKMLSVAATRFIQRASGARQVNPGLRSIVLHNPNGLSALQRDMLAAYCRLRHHLPTIDRAGDIGADHFSIATYDPSTLPEVRDVISGTRFKLFVIDSPEQETAMKERLLAGLLDARIIAMAPDDSGDIWIRKKAGIPVATSKKASALSRELEDEFVSSLHSMTDGANAKKSGILNISITRAECIAIARATPGMEVTAPVANFTKSLIELLAIPPILTGHDEQRPMETVVNAITAAKPIATVAFRVANLTAKFGGLPPPAQKKLVRIATRAADLDHKRLAYNLAAQKKAASG
ncbi:hypothetical protein GCM10019059_35690 [Camelimonas fluminis]|nr:hypothetical protein GCM10019059_35690 [Camelimonas fluminis]